MYQSSTNSIDCKVTETLDQLIELGIDPILVRPDSKAALNFDPIQDQRSRVGNKIDEYNIGIRGGGNVGALPIDCDDQQTVAAFRRYLAGLGYDCARDITPSGNSHLYLRVRNVPASIRGARILAKGLKGEARIGPRCATVVPRSRYHGKFYLFEVGDWKSFAQQRVLDWSDLLPIVAYSEKTERQRSANHGVSQTLPVFVPWRPAPKCVVELFELLSHAKKGDSVGRFPSRSEAEGSIVATLIRHGWRLDQLITEFGKYGIVAHNLPLTYQTNLNAIMSGEHCAYWLFRLAQPVSFTGPGRRKNLAQRLYIAIIAAGYMRNADPDQGIRVSYNELMLAVNGRFNGVCRALDRLQSCEIIEYKSRKNEGLLIWTKDVDGTFGYIEHNIGVDKPIYKLIDQESTDHIDQESTHIPDLESKKLTPESIKFLDSSGSLTTQLVFEKLSADPQSIKQLAEKIAVERHAVKRCLTWLKDRDLALEVAAGAWCLWIVGSADLESLARSWADSSADWLGKREGDF